MTATLGLVQPPRRRRAARFIGIAASCLQQRIKLRGLGKLRPVCSKPQPCLSIGRPLCILCVQPAFLGCAAIFLRGCLSLHNGSPRVNAIVLGRSLQRIASRCAQILISTKPNWQPTSLLKINEPLCDILQIICCGEKDSRSRAPEKRSQIASTAWLTLKTRPKPKHKRRF